MNNRIEDNQILPEISLYSNKLQDMDYYKSSRKSSIMFDIDGPLLKLKRFGSDWESFIEDKM